MKKRLSSILLSLVFLTSCGLRNAKYEQFINYCTEKSEDSFTTVENKVFTSGINMKIENKNVIFYSSIPSSSTKENFNIEFPYRSATPSTYKCVYEETKTGEDTNRFTFYIANKFDKDKTEIVFENPLLNVDKYYGYKVYVLNLADEFIKSIGIYCSEKINISFAEIGIFSNYQ